MYRLIFIFSIKVIVTDADGSDSDTNAVTVNFDDCDPNEPPFEPCDT